MTIAPLTLALLLAAIAIAQAGAPLAAVALLAGLAVMGELLVATGNRE